MATMVLAEFIKRTRDELVAGVCEDIYTLNPIFSLLPWDGYTGSGITVNRETTIGDSQIVAINGTITAKAASAVTPVLFRSTTLLGDAEIDNKQVAESQTDINDVVATEISSKAKSIGRLMQACIAGTSADGNAALFNSLHSLVDATQYVSNNTVGGEVLTLEMLDNLLAMVDSKDGQVDWIQMTQRDFNKYKALLRALGGTAAEWLVALPDGRTTLGYENIPIFVNRWLSVTETDDAAALTGGAQSSIYAGNFDDGTRKVGCSLIHPEALPAGISVEEVGPMEAKDQGIWRVKSYCNFVNYNRRGLARLTGIKAG